MRNTFNFKVLQKDSKTKVRLGQLTTPHGIIDTPAFVPVGTRATVRGLTPSDLKEIGVQILFGNTYHLHLRPGEELIQEMGGLAKFMSWDGPTITDSGGFQIFSLIHREGTGSLTHVARPAHYAQKKLKVSTRSLSEKRQQTNTSLEENSESFFSCLANDQASSFKKIEDNSDAPKLVKITDDGVIFRSHIDGSLHEFTPEKSILIQKKLGADIILAFDECAPHPSTYEYTKEAMERTHEWASRCLETFSRTPSEESRSLPRHLGGGSPELIEGYDSSEVNNQALYGIIQGGIYKDLREESAKFISEEDFLGIAVGGVSVGESKKEMRDVLEWVSPYLPDNKPRHLSGIGEIDDIFDGVERGIDTFDCVIPTRFGRYGIVLVTPPQGNIKNNFRISIAKTTFAKDKEPLDKNCNCNVCANFTRAYIHHLFRSDELLSYRLVSYHNVYFIVNLMREIRESIKEGRFVELKAGWLK